MPYAVITIDRVDKQEASYVHLYDKSQKAWNCNKQELFDILIPGERVKIDYNETEPKAGRKFGSKYINRARPWTPEDGDNTWPDKEQYTGGGGHSKGGGKVSKDYDPTVGKRQTAANVAGNIVVKIIEQVPDSDKLEAFKTYFPVVADIVFEWVDTQPKSGAGQSGDEDIPF